jgi:hypothetical protein
MNVDHERFARVIQRPQQRPILTISAIGCDPGKPYAIATRPLYELKSQSGFGLQDLAF